MAWLSSSFPIRFPDWPAKRSAPLPVQGPFASATGPHALGPSFQTSSNGQGHRLRQQRRHCVADLVELAPFRAAKGEPVRKALEARPLTNRQSPPPPVWKADTEHVARRAVQVPAGDRAAGLIQVEVARADAF